jgi:hypothetical protein
MSFAGATLEASNVRHRGLHGSHESHSERDLRAATLGARPARLEDARHSLDSRELSSAKREMICPAKGRPAHHARLRRT